MTHHDLAAQTNVVRLPDGRNLAYVEYGAALGTPVFFFHGLPSCRLMHPDDNICRALGLRLIAADRPGFGRSDPQRFFDRYTRHNPPADQALLQRPDVRAMFLASYAEATRQGIDALRFQSFATLGHLWYACCTNNQAVIGSGNPASSGQLTRCVNVF